ncbi:hypothetical protein QYE76_038302 [Lolium multiflorum]|uniref:Response regulatory domain-containing protein n=1 Tax=Lolium multiflorum TaxID=4521 RepID=A0AAD8T7M3_LOLMU|nr:hypothetical protein QYE76_038302 [Lolium multiflorum]
MASNAQGSHMKALLVEDAAVETLFHSAILHMFHCETTVAKTGKEAVDLFLEGKKFDIVLCEKEMPVMNGLEAVEKIRAIGETDVKIVGVSVDCNAMEAFMSAGADVFVPKPITLDVLSAIIQEIINKKNNAMV